MLRVGIHICASALLGSMFSALTLKCASGFVLRLTLTIKLDPNSVQRTSAKRY